MNNQEEKLNGNNNQPAEQNSWSGCAKKGTCILNILKSSVTDFFTFTDKRISIVTILGILLTLFFQIRSDSKDINEKIKVLQSISIHFIALLSVILYIFLIGSFFKHFFDYPNKARKTTEINKLQLCSFNIIGVIGLILSLCFLIFFFSTIPILSNLFENFLDC